MAQKTEVLLPDIGDFTDVEVIEVLVRPGDSVLAEDPLITLESDKASMEIPAPRAGTVAELRVAVGDRVSQGDLILLLEADAASDTASAGQAEPDRDAPGEPAPAPAEPADIPAPAASAAALLREVALPDIGDFQDVEIIELLVAEGDSVEAEQSLIMLESDKATMEIPAPFGGVVKSLKVGVGDKVSQGDPIAAIETSAAAGLPTPAVAPDQAGHDDAPNGTQRPAGEKAPLSRPVVTRPSDAPRGKPHASPGVRRFARKLGVDLYQVSGSGPKGRISRDDVQAFVKQALAGGTVAAAPAAVGGPQLPAMPEVDFAKFGEIEEQALGRIKKLSGAHLHRAWLNVPHVTQFDEADITELEAFRKAHKEEAARAEARLTFMPFLMKALCKALREYPQFNSSLSVDGEKLILKRYVHIGVAVDTPNGLVVPVLRDVDKKGIFELARELGEIGGRARAGKLSPGEMQGGCISISSLGGIGGTQFAPIINAPEVAILGISQAQMQPIWDGEGFVPRLILPFSLSYDHRVIDGAEGVRFTRYLGELLADIRRLLL